MKLINKIFTIIFLVVLPFLIYLNFPFLFSYLNIKSSDYWWLGTTIILVGVPFIILLHLLGYRIELNFEKLGIKLFKQKNGK